MSLVRRPEYHNPPCRASARQITFALSTHRNHSCARSFLPMHIRMSKFARLLKRKPPQRGRFVKQTRGLAAYPRSVKVCKFCRHVLRV